VPGIMYKDLYVTAHHDSIPAVYTGLTRIGMAAFTCFSNSCV